MKYIDIVRKIDEAIEIAETRREYWRTEASVREGKAATKAEAAYEACIAELDKLYKLNRATR